MTSRRSLLVRLLGVLAAVSMAVLGLALPAAAATSGYIESHAADPVSAAPGVTRPDTPHCTVTLAQDFPSNAADGSPQSFSGTLVPPAACPGPWSKVVLDYTTTVSGRQYDRSGSLQVGGATIWFGTTQEPDGAAPTTFSFSKDLTRFSALFRSPQPYSGGYGNYTSSVYTGVYRQTATLTFYEPDAAYPPPPVPDVVRGVPIGDLNPGTPSRDVTLTDLPRNITRADLEVTLKGNGCDEQWFTAVPDDVAAQFPGDGLCAAGPYREAAFALDGKPAGAVGTFPHIYSGGIVPTLWRPVLAIDTLDLRPENLDLTPFAGTLVDGGSHQLSVSMSPIGDNWNVMATLFLWTDHHAAQTSGALTQDSVAAGPALSSTCAPASPGVQYTVTAHRNDVIAGYVDSSAGRVYTRDTYLRQFSNSGQVSDHGLVQSIDQTDNVTQSSVSTQDGRTVRSERLVESYPISVDFSAASFVNDQNFTLQGTVDMAQHVTDLTRDGSGQTRRGWAWKVDSTGVLARSNGVTSEADGSATTLYAGTDDQGRPYFHRIVADHGQIVSNVER
jgi:Peptide N-acetyl-beta-D-glucosaminyl asparaginase amidase A